MRYNDFDATLLLLRNRLALYTWRNLAVNEILDKSADIVMCNLLALVKGEFLVLDGFLNCESGPFVGFEVEIASVCAEGLGVDGSDVDLALVFLGDGLEFFSEGSAFFGCFCENVAKGDASLCIKLVDGP